MDNNRIIYLIIGSICIIILALGVTTAWFTWNSTTNTDVTFNVNGIDIINTNIDIVGKELYPTINKDNGIVEEFTVKQNNEISTPVCSDFTLTLTTLPTELQHKSFKYKLYNGTNLVGSGNFEGKTQGQVITIATGQPVTGNISTYKLYIWIDGTMDNPLSMGGKSFLFKLSIKASQQENACTPSEADDSGANEPVLAEGMIPVKYDDANSKWIKASTDNWYNYDDKKWANAVMVTSDTRDSYMSGTTKPIGSEVLEDDILAYYVWIPRYKYQLFNVASEEMNPIEIQVKFERKDTTKSTGSTNGSWLTHPAFTFGDDELSGIWVGKFETSIDTSDACYANTTDTSCDKELDSPRIKPNLISLKYQKMSNKFLTSKNFATTNYLTSNGVNQVDAHMMKNTEWGAVAYLKQSKYGLGTTDIANNNSVSNYTGRSSGDASVTETSTEGTYKYNESGQRQIVVEGTGTNLNIASPVSDATYTWTNIGTAENPIWKSATQGVKSSTTTLTYTFTLSGNGALSFDYSVSSANDYFGHLYYTITKDNTVVDKTGTITKISGTSYGTDDASMSYVSKAHILSSGTYTLEFTYKKDGYISGGTDSGYVKNVKVLEDVTINTIKQEGGAASTTGNVTGVYDMAGGEIEFVMGLTKTSNNEGLIYSGVSSYSSSGFTASTLPLGSKYVDAYTYGTTYNDQDAYNRRILGDATGEVRGWYSCNAAVSHAKGPLIGRGGSASYGSNSGIFAFYVAAGDAAFRSVLSPQ